MSRSRVAVSQSWPNCLRPAMVGVAAREAGFMTVLTEKPPIQLPREKPMFTKLVTKSRGAIVMAGVAASIGLGVA